MATEPVDAHMADVQKRNSPPQFQKRPYPGMVDGGPAQKLMKPRASRACESCHSRKVRCDVVLSSPCTNCRLDKIACVERERRKPPPRTAPPENNHERPAASIDASEGAWPDDIPRTYVPALTTMNPSTSTKHKLPSFLNPLLPQLVESESDINYLHSRGALTLPSVALQNALMQAYIEYIYPYMPSIDLHDFLHIIDNRDGSAGKTSLLLYQCVMFAATGFVPMQALREAGYASRKEIRKQFFTKVRLLYDFDCEPNRFVVVQSLLLMTYWHDTIDGQKDLWHWMSVTVNTAHTIDLQRDPVLKGVDPVRCKLWKRVWWSCFMRDRLISLCMRKPAKIWEEDSDMPMLVEDDFEIEALSETNSIIPPSCEVIRNTQMQRELALHCIAKAKLCVYIGRIIKSQYSNTMRNPQNVDNTDESTMTISPNNPSQHLDVLDRLTAELEVWYQELPPECQYRHMVVSDTEPTAPTLAIHRVVLHLMHQATLMALHKPWSAIILPPNTPEDILAKQEASKMLVRNAASMISEMAGEAHLRNLGSFMPGVVVILVLPAATTQLEAMCVQDQTKKDLAARAFVNCVQIMNTLRQSFYGADYAATLLGAALIRLGLDGSTYSDPEVSETVEQLKSAAPDFQKLMEKAGALAPRNLAPPLPAQQPNSAASQEDGDVDLTQLLLVMVGGSKLGKNNTSIAA